MYRTGSHFGRASTVSLCEGRGRDKPAATSADELSPTSNDNVVKWRTYSNKAADLAKEVRYTTGSKGAWASNLSECHLLALKRLTDGMVVCRKSMRTQRDI